MGKALNSIRHERIKAAIVSILVFGTVVARGQGIVIFANLGGGVNAPVFDSLGNRIVDPSPYVADLFWSSDTNSVADSLIPGGYKTAFPTNSLYAGYFFGGIVTLPVVWIPVLAQVRVWDTNYGSTYYEARDNGGEYGFSNFVLFIAAPSIGALPNNLVGLQGFQLQRLPHLSVSTTETNTLLFSWPTNITNYTIQRNTDLSTENWTTVSSAPVVIDSQNQVTIPKPDQSMFYRLVSQ